MKSIKGLALGAALAGVVFTGAANADAATIGKDVAGTKYEEATTKLAALGITKGYPDGTVRPDENVTRAQTAAFMIRALNYQLSMDQSTTVFSDVAYEHPLSGAVQLASGKGIIKGYLDGTFRAEESVTIAQASAILVRMLGYSPAINEADFPNSHLSKAAELGILKGVKADVNAPAKRGDIMLMVSNALTVDLMKQTEWGNDHKWEEKKDENLLTEFFDLTVVETRKDYQEEYGDKNYKGDLPRVRDTARTKIGSLKANEMEFEGIGGVHTLSEMFNATDFLGQEVQVWIDEDEDHVVYIADSKDQKVVFDKFDKWDYKDKKNNIKLDNGDDYEILDDAVVYYNLDKPLKFKDFKKKENMDEKGATSLVKVILDSNEDVVGMVVTNITEGDYGLVEEVKTDKKMIDFMDGSASTSQLKLDGKDFFIVRNGAIAELKDLEKEDVVNYYRDGDKYYILATADQASGKIDDVKFTRPDDESSYKLHIGDKKYPVAKAATYSDNKNEDIEDVDADDLDEMDGIDATFYLDAAGDIRHIVTGELGSTVGNVAVVTKNIKWLSQDEEWELTIVNENGKEVKYRFEHDDIDVDGKERKDEYIYKNLTIDSSVSNAKDKFSGTVKNDYIFIEYSVNKDGKLKAIDILRTADQAKEWEKQNPNEKLKEKYSDVKFAEQNIKLDKYDDNVKIGGQAYKVTRNSVFFDVTNNKKDFTHNDKNEYEDVDTIKWDDIKDKETDIKKAYVKLKTNGRDVDYMFVTESDKNLKSKGEYGFITGFKKVGRDDAVSITRIDGEKLTLVLDEKNYDLPTDYNFLKGKKDDLKTKGAFIRYELNSDNEIDDWQVIASAGTKGGLYMAPGDEDDYSKYSIDYVTAGIVEKSSSSSITLVELKDQKNTTRNGNVVVNSNTVYIDMVDDGEMDIVGGVNRGDFVLAVDTDDDGNAADFVIIIGEDYKVDGTGKETGGDSSKDPGKVEDGKVTHVNKDRLLVDGERYILDADTVLRDKTKTGKILAVGGEEIAGILKSGAIVDVVEVKDGVAATVVLVKTDADAKAEDNAAVAAAEKLFEGKTFKDEAAIKAVEVKDGVKVEVKVTEEATGTKAGKAAVTLTKGEADPVTVEVILEKLPLNAPKDGLKELAVKDLKAEDVKFLVFGLGTPQEAVTLNEVAAFMLTEYDVTFNRSAIKIEDGKISIVGSILSTEDWKKVKAKGGDETVAYKITVLNSDKTAKIAKIAMYEDGVAVIEEL